MISLTRCERVLLNTRLAQFVDANCVPIDVILDPEAVTKNDVHHSERERAVRAGHDRNVLVRLFRCSCPQGSIVTILAPLERAFRMYRHRWILDVMMFEPQIRMYFA